MILAAILSVLVGAVLGLRFKVFVLVPVVALGWILFFALGAPAGGWSRGLAMALIAVAAEIGFVCGTSTRLVLATARTTRRRRHWRPASTGSPGSVG